MRTLIITSNQFVNSVLLEQLEVKETNAFHALQTIFMNKVNVQNVQLTKFAQSEQSICFLSRIFCSFMKSSKNQIHKYLLLLKSE